MSDASTTQKPGHDRVLLGQIGAAHGIKGEVRIKSFTDAPLDISTYGPLQTNRADVEITITKSRLSKGLVIASLKGIADRNKAETLNGIKLFTASENLATLEDEDEFYHSDLIGLTANDSDGNEIGTLVSIENYGAGDIIELKLTNGKTELLPFSKKIAPEIDLAKKSITIIMPEIIIVQENLNEGANNDMES